MGGGNVLHWCKVTMGKWALSGVTRVLRPGAHKDSGNLYEKPGYSVV